MITTTFWVECYSKTFISYFISSYLCFIHLCSYLSYILSIYHLRSVLTTILINEYCIALYCCDKRKCGTGMSLTNTSSLLQSTTMTSLSHHPMTSLSALVAAITLLLVSPTHCFSVSDESPLTTVHRITPYPSASAHLAAGKSATAVRSLA